MASHSTFSDPSIIGQDMQPYQLPCNRSSHKQPGTPTYTLAQPESMDRRGHGSGSCAPRSTAGKLPFTSPTEGQPRPYGSNLISQVGQNFSNSWLKSGKRLNCFTLHFCHRKSKCPLRCDWQEPQGPPPGVPSEFRSAAQVRKFGTCLVFRKHAYPLYAIRTPSASNFARQRF